ncbi:Hint domain-containing protein [Pseudoponticoccus marisrubri]|uniref:Hint domain-containing protein n=1 Tax=Pseudoponticoccus marisrubri TaxID=1685382 RepID=UPI001F0B2146|nr:Hint domain-containing protein [Pseudoponticoccus marisrubri]
MLTLDGALPVEFLEPGDRVITRDQGASTLRAVARRQIACRMIEIRGGSLGHTRPGRDIRVPAEQRVLIRDWRARALFGRPQALVPAARLVDGSFVRDLGMRQVDLVALRFDAPHILYADGLELASAPGLTAPA